MVGSEQHARKMAAFRGKKPEARGRVASRLGVIFLGDTSRACSLVTVVTGNFQLTCLWQGQGVTDRARARAGGIRTKLVSDAADVPAVRVLFTDNCSLASGFFFSRRASSPY